MAIADDSSNQCRAITADGERCTREANEDGFCYQHGPEDDTVDDDAESSDREENEPEAGETDQGDAESNETEDGDTDTEDAEDMSQEDGNDIDSVRSRVEHVTEDLIGRPLVGVVAVERDGGSEDDERGWRAAVEVIERNSVPSTEDILGRYEISIDASGTITDYRRTHRYRRGDMSQDV